jgi:hypothetical protein
MFKCRRAGVPGRLAPGYAVWMPEDNHPMGPRAAQLQMTHFDALMPQKLGGLAAAQAYEVNPQVLLGAHELACRLNHSYFNMASDMSDDPAEKSSYLDQAAAFALTASHTGFDVRKKVSEKVQEKIERLNKAVLDERGYRRSKSAIKYLDKDVLERFRSARVIAMQDMQKVNQSLLSDRQATYLLQKSEHYWDRTIGRQKWHLSNVFDTADLAMAAEMMEHVAHGLFIVDAGMAIHDVYEKWKEGKDWEYEVIQDAADIGAAIVIGGVTATAFALFCAGGWVICLVAGVVAAAGSLAFDHYVNPLGQAYIEPFIEKLRMRG